MARLLLMHAPRIGLIPNTKQWCAQNNIAASSWGQGSALGLLNMLRHVPRVYISVLAFLLRFTHTALLQYYPRPFFHCLDFFYLLPSTSTPRIHFESISTTEPRKHIIKDDHHIPRWRRHSSGRCFCANSGLRHHTGDASRICQKFWLGPFNYLFHLPSHRGDLPAYSDIASVNGRLYGFHCLHLHRPFAVDSHLLGTTY